MSEWTQIPSPRRASAAFARNTLARFGFVETFCHRGSACVIRIQWMRNRSVLVGSGRFLSSDRSESDPIKFAPPVTDMEHFLYQCSCEHANSLTVWSKRYRRAKRMHERAVRAHDARGPSTL